MNRGARLSNMVVHEVKHETRVAEVRG